MKRKFDIKALVTLALLVAMQVVLEKLCAINTLTVKIGFGFVPVAVGAMLYGPVGGGVVGALGDIVGSLLFPTGAYFPGFTVTAALIGVVWGLFLPQKHLGYPVRVVLPAVINNIVLGLGVNTLFIALLYTHKHYTAMLVSRLPEYAIMLPLTLIFIPIFEKITEKLLKKNKSSD